MPQRRVQSVLQLFLLAALTTTPLWAASDPLTGKWKLDPARSKRIDLMRVAAAGPNTYTLIFNNGGVETVVADGTDQPGIFGTTVSVRIEGPSHWIVVRKQNGRTLLTGNWVLADDGKTLTDHFTSYPPNGAPSTINYVYTRTAGDTGFPGSWEAPSDERHAFEIQIQPWQDDGLSFSDPSEGSTKNFRFDGKDYPWQGAYAPPGATSSARRTSNRALEITDAIQGRVADTQQIEVSPDLKTLTLTEHTAGQSQPNILVFDRE